MKNMFENFAKCAFKSAWKDFQKWIFSFQTITVSIQMSLDLGAMNLTIIFEALQSWQITFLFLQGYGLIMHHFQTFSPEYKEISVICLNYWYMFLKLCLEKTVHHSNKKGFP